MSSLVLGAGPVGLLAAFRIPEAVVIGETVGPSALTAFAPTYLWRTPRTTRLLADVGLPAAPRTVRFGYLSCDGPSDACSPEERAEYYRRSRGIPLGTPFDVPTSSMSSGIPGHLETFDVSVDELAAALLDRLRGRVVSAKIVSLTVTPTGVVAYLSTGGVVTGAAAVNTLPAPVFDKLRGGVIGDWPAGSKTFVVGAAYLSVIEAARHAGYEYVYTVDPRLPFDRVKFLPRAVCYEFNGDVPDGFVKSVSGAVAASGKYQILGRSRPEWEPPVRHLGRMARWDHAIRLHNVAEAIGE